MGVEVGGGTPVFMGMPYGGYGYGNGCNGGWGNDGMLAFFIVAMMMGGGGWFNRGGGMPMMSENLARQSDVQNGFDFLNLQDQTRDINNNVTRASYDNIGATKDAAAFITRDINNLSQQVAANAANQENCCCQTLRAIDSVNYNNALNTCNIEKAIEASNRQLNEKMDRNRMDDMQNEINQLRLAQAMQGVVRYPNGFVYTAGNSPFCGCHNNNSCGCSGLLTASF